jgi:hypothetical protein
MTTTEERQKECAHGVVFDEEAAGKLLKAAPSEETGDAALDFILGSPASEVIRKHWPRGWFTAEKPCPQCGYVGIYYASYAHYMMGDW